MDASGIHSFVESDFALLWRTMVELRAIVHQR